MTPVANRFGTTLLAAFIASTALAPSPAAAADPIGTWLTEDGRARVRTEHCGPTRNNLCGFVVWLQKPLDDKGQPRVDQFNPDTGKKARPVLGHQMLLGLKQNEEGRYAGKIYSGDNGKAYDVTVWSESPAELSVKGCMLAVFCGSQVWKRVADVVPGQLTGATDAVGGPHLDPEWATKPNGSAPARKSRAESQAVPMR